MTAAHYIDTRPGAPGLFAAPAECGDYGSWLRELYDRGLALGTHEHLPVGVRQRVNALVFDAVSTGAALVAIGPHAAAAAAVVEEVSGGAVSVEVAG
jgi:hypothetical protein